MAETPHTTSSPGSSPDEQEARLLDQPTQALPPELVAPTGGPLAPGERLGRYTLVGTLGEGGMARVYLGEREDGSRAALKVLRQVEAQADPTLWERFEREAEVMARLDHPHVVRLIERGVDAERGLHYLALEHVRGSDLGTILSRCPAQRFSVPEASLVLGHVARGLASVHQAGVLHRDIKPGNVLITRKGQVKLIDFGIALSADHVQRLTERDYVIGTLLYLAPEVLVDSRWEAPADVYSLGCVAYRMLTGTLPFMQRQLKSLLHAHRAETPVPVLKHAPQVPPALSDLVGRMIQVDPAPRPSAEEVVAKLAELGLCHESQVARQWSRGRVGSGEFEAPPGIDDQDAPTSAEEVALARLVGQAYAPIESGQQLGPFEVVRFLDRGAMGDVYLCERGGERFALKLIAEELLAEEESRVRFEREIEALIQLGAHPGIVRVRAHGRTPGGRPWFATDYVEGRSLRQALEAGLPMAQALDAVEQLADALAYAHQQGLVHRDLKPDNVLLTAEGRCLLLDFGLTKAVGRETQSLTRTGEILGTPSYMAPEQVDSDLGVVGTWTDVYQLGCLLYRVLAERTPYTGSTAVEIYAKLVQGKSIPQLRKLVPEIEPGLAAICHTALARDPGDRFRDAGVLVAELHKELWPERDTTLRALLLVSVLSVLLAGTTILALQFRTLGGGQTDHRQDLERLRALVDEERYADAVSAGEALLASRPPGGGELASALGEITDLLDAARARRASEVFAVGDSVAARSLLTRAQVAPPETPWILAASGEFAEALAAATGAPPQQRARLAAWAGDAPAFQAALADVPGRHRAEALAWELREYTGWTPAALGGRAGAAESRGWEQLALGERCLAQGLTSLAWDAFGRVRGDHEARFAAALGKLRTAIARGAWGDAVAAWREARPLAAHPLDLPRLQGWAHTLAAAADRLEPDDASLVVAWCAEAERRAPGLRRGPGLRPLLARAEAASAARGPAAGLAALGAATSETRFGCADRRACVTGLGGPEGILLARGLQLAAAARQLGSADLGGVAEELLGIAAAWRPDSPTVWVGLAWARLAARTPNEGLLAAQQARAVCREVSLGLLELEALAAGLVPLSERADRARAEGSPASALELELAGGWLRIFEACQELRAQDAAEPRLGVWSARCRLWRARRLVGAGSESLLDPSADLVSLIEGITADTAPALDGLDVLELVRARVALAQALVDGTSVAEPERQLAAAASALEPARRELALEALALRASAWTVEPRLHAEAYLALAADLPARVALTVGLAQRDPAARAGHLDHARALGGDDPLALLQFELSKFSDALVTRFGDDAGAYQALARIVEQEPSWIGAVVLAMRAQPLTAARLDVCLAEGLDDDAYALARALALLSAGWGPDGVSPEACLAAVNVALAQNPSSTAAHAVRLLALARVGRGEGLAKPDPDAHIELRHAAACSGAGSLGTSAPGQLTLLLPGALGASLDGLFAEGFVGNPEGLLVPLDGSGQAPEALERAVARLRALPVGVEHAARWVDAGGARTASTLRLLAAEVGAPEPDWSLLAGGDPAREAALQVRYALRVQQPERAVLRAAEALARWGSRAPSPPQALPRLEGPMLSGIAHHAWPAERSMWTALHVTPSEVLADLLRGLEASADGTPREALGGTVAFFAWSRAAAILTGARDSALQAEAAEWLLEPDALETRLALERVLAFSDAESLCDAVFGDLLPVARALDAQAGRKVWRALGSAAEGALAQGVDAEPTRQALRALAVEALLQEAGDGERGALGALEAAWGYAREGDRVDPRREAPLWAAWRRVRLLAALGRQGPALEQGSRVLAGRLAQASDEQVGAWRLAARGDPWLAPVTQQPACAGLSRWLTE